MPRYRHEGEACDSGVWQAERMCRVCLGIFVKCTSSYFAGANCDPCFRATSLRFDELL